MSQRHQSHNIVSMCLVALFFVLVGSSVYAQNGLNTDARFRSEQAGFAIQFPGKPTVKSFSTPTEHGDIELTTYSFEDLKKLAFNVSVSKFPEEYPMVNTPRKLLAHSRQAAVEALSIQSFEIDESIELNGYPGVHFKGTSGFYFVIFKIFVVDGNQYQLAMLQTKRYPTDEEANAFFNSFELLVNHAQVNLRNARGLPGLEDELEPFISPDNSFRVLFPRAPLLDTSIVKTDVGDVELYRFKVDRGNEALTIAFSEYPTALVELSDPKELLIAGKNSTMTGLGLTTIDEEKTIELSGYPGTYFRGHSDQYYTVYKAYMVNNRLYQIAITRSGAYPSKAEVKQFMESFQLN